MSYRINLSDVEAVCRDARNLAADIGSLAKGMSSGAQAVLSLGAFAGQGAEACRARVSECSFALSQALAVVASSISCESSLYLSSWHELEGADSALLGTDEITEVAKRALAGWGTFQGIVSDIQHAVWGVDDIVSPALPSPQGALSAFARCRTESEITRDKGEAIEAQGAARAASVSSLLDSLESFVSKCESTAPKGLLFKSGELSSSAEFGALGDAAGASAKRVFDSWDELEAANALKAKVEDDRDAEKSAQRLTFGLMGLGLAGIGFAGAIGVGGVAGAVSMAFAGSDLYEAAHNVYLGATGDPDTEAFNPLRDTVFMGNDAVYFVAELGAGGWAAFSGSGTSAADDIAERFAQDGHIPDLGHSAADDIAEDGTQTLDCAGINKAREWDYPQDAYEYLRHKVVYDNPAYFDQQTGEVRWPPDDGFVPGTRRNETLEPGTIMTRVGNEDGGYYFSPRETSIPERSLPPFKTSGEVKSYEVIRPLPVESGLIAPTFGEPGGGTQWITEHDVTWLIDNGYITPRR